MSQFSASYSKKIKALETQIGQVNTTQINKLADNSLKASASYTAFLDGMTVMRATSALTGSDAFPEQNGLLITHKSGNYTHQEFETANARYFRFWTTAWTSWSTIAKKETSLTAINDPVSSSTNWNTLVHMGVYSLNNGVPFGAANNQPVGAYPYGELNVFANGSIVTQMYVPHNVTGTEGKGFYMRSKFNVSDWGPWQQFLNGVEIAALLTGLENKAQMYKITPDSGGFNYVLSKSSDDVHNISGNLSTAYFNNVPANSPPSESYRAIYVSDTDTRGELIALGTDQSIWRKSKLGGSWSSWERMISQKDFDMKPLWTGASYMNESSTVTPTKKLSECLSGWILVWSDYDVGSGTNDFDFAYSVIPKFLVSGGQTNLFSIPNYTSATKVSHTIKKLRVYNDRLVGYPENQEDAIESRDVVLRAVLPF